LVQLDPLNSPHPIPWNWILAAHGTAVATGRFLPQYYRSATLRSPDGQWLAYSRISLTLQPHLYACQASSILLLEHVSQGSLQAVSAIANGVFPYASSAVNPGSSLDSGVQPDPSMQAHPGAIEIVMPLAWSKGSDRLLCRQFEGRFCSSMATDSALLWEAATRKTQMIAPLGQEQAVLLGWSQLEPDALLFEAGSLDQAHLPRWRLALDGTAVQAPANDAPLVYGEAIADAFTGPQTSLC
jgi:hypothetical protein